MTKYSFIELNIDELVLSGFQLKDRNVIGKSVETELERLLTNNGHRNLFEKNIKKCRDGNSDNYYK